LKNNFGGFQVPESVGNTKSARNFAGKLSFWRPKFRRPNPPEIDFSGGFPADLATRIGPLFSSAG
jgi:hypothetical protein